jgi:hypothetical protein
VASLEIILGIPDWTFWGIVVPWMACLVITWLFLCCIFQEDSLGNERLDDD